MKRLKNKVFFTIFLILTITLMSFITVFNIQNYMEQRDSIINSMNIAADNVNNANNFNFKNNDKDNISPLKSEEEIDDDIINPPFNNQSLDKNIKFMDSVVYTILIDSKNNIKEIVNHSDNELSNAEISNLATTILDNKKIRKRHIGCLYLEDYSYLYNESNYLVIFDNSKIKESLLSSLKISIIIFIIFEGMILLVSKIITIWIIKPVKISFDKQKQFIADASHELKTPLSVIITSSEALEDSPKEKKWLKNIRTEANRMNSLIMDLLELSSTETDKKYEYKSGNLSKIVELSVLTFEGRAFEKKLKLNYQIEDNINFNMNENQIKQLIEILLDNAINHSYKNEIINLILIQENNTILLSVENKGDVIPLGEEEKIFERFYRSDKSRNRKDNRYGLGLAIAKNIVENHKGKITVSSKDNITIFKVLFKK